MLAVVLLALLPVATKRDDYGVPIIEADSASSAYFQVGYAVAEDRLWQMESSRRLSQGRMAEVFGKAFAASDTEVLKTAYTNEELNQQFLDLAPSSQVFFESYARGVNAYIDWAKANSKLPAGYATNGFQPEPWTTTDSVAISIRLLRTFGRGGAGEIRNLALLKYLQGRAETKDRAIDVLNDFAWFNDPKAIPTVAPSEDRVKERPVFPIPTQKVTEAHLALIPQVGLLDLLPGIRLAENGDSNLIAEAQSVPYKMGSYAIVVSPSRSATGQGFLLNGPQMGFQTPSIVHEMAISYPGFAAAGMDVPGVPGVLIGYTPNLAWGLTSGVADTDDIFFVKSVSPTEYAWGKERRLVQTVTRVVKVKGEPDVSVKRTTTALGPVIINSQGHLFCQRMSYYGKEMKSYDALMLLQNSRSVAEAGEAMKRATNNFNTFVATATGETGYFYVGSVPLRSAKADPRFPTPGSPENDWKGMIPYDSMPKSFLPNTNSESQRGLIVNWNNKPVSWWANSDTPVWGRIFRNEAIQDNLPEGKIAVADAELAIWKIARAEPTAKYFMPLIRKHITARDEAARYLIAFDGKNIAGSQSAAIYAAFLDALREEIFIATTGSFISMDNFRLAAQPSVMLNALERKTKINYLGSRTVADVINAAFTTACNRLKAKAPNPADWRYIPGGIRTLDQPSIPYSDRGTYIQIIEVGKTTRGRNVLTPGTAESGAHSADQVALARAWMYKPMPILKE